MRAHEVAALVSLALLILAYVIPYTLLRGSKGWELYTFWTLLSMTPPRPLKSGVSNLWVLGVSPPDGD